ncbi:MAG: hypothetical protein HC929_22910 [Leptolyngbyaceae cyanobacterium SM2_5_2]|nr:hypothetical protein [Leptolyngbyaceae cyanobacterium SM2_5_2]
MATPVEIARAERQVFIYSGDRKTAAHLLHATRLRYPHRSLRWCVEKTLLTLSASRCL